MRGSPVGLNGEEERAGGILASCEGRQSLSLCCPPAQQCLASPCAPLCFVTSTNEVRFDVPLKMKRLV